MLNKLAYIGMYIMELNKVLTYEFHYDYIKNKYFNNSRLVFTDNDSLMYEIKAGDIKLEMSLKILTAIEKCLNLVIIEQSQNIMIVQLN